MTKLSSQKQTNRASKILARAGLASRREAENLIRQGRVQIQGETLRNLARPIRQNESLTLDGQPVPQKPPPPKIWLYHKPPGIIVSRRDPKGRPSIFDALPKNMRNLKSIGRLDLTSEGLLLLTNDGALARHLELPRSGFIRRYRARARGRLPQDALQRLKNGIRIDKMRYAPIKASLDRDLGGTLWLSLELREGKNREIRKILEALGLTVARLIRTDFGPFSLGRLPRGAIKEAPPRLARAVMDV